MSDVRVANRGEAVVRESSRAEEGNATGFVLPPTISPQARDYFFQNMSRAARDAVTVPDDDDLQGWDAYNQAELARRKPGNRALVARYGCRLETLDLAGVPVLSITPPGWEDDDSTVFYTHGGGFVGGTAADAMDSTLPIATEGGLRVLSVDYMLAPRADFMAATRQVATAISALGSPVGLYGDSAGGGLAAASALRLRDEGSRLVKALVLWSPWVDLACRGDTAMTLSDVEPFYTYETLLRHAARVYAGDNLAHPYASPVNGDFAGGYPPTLIQCGTRELLLSDSVRLYQALVGAGREATLDLYEGMWHVFQFKPIDAPEASTARARSIAFLRNRL